jgi:hypothetical protein
MTSAFFRFGTQDGTDQSAHDLRSGVALGIAVAFAVDNKPNAGVDLISATLLSMPSSSHTTSRRNV